MANDVYADGNTRVSFVAAIASIAAPTVAELNAGILLHSIITPDGLVGFLAETQPVDRSALDSTYDLTGVGRDRVTGSLLRFKKQSGVDTAYNTLTRGTEGYVVFRRDVAASTAWAAGQKVEVFPVAVGREKNLPPEPNSLRKWESPMFIREQPELRAVVA